MVQVPLPPLPLVRPPALQGLRPALAQVTLQAGAAVAAHLAAAEAQADVPPEAAAALKASGYPALTVPVGAGGLGASLPEFALAQAWLGRSGASLAMVLAMNAHVLGSAFAARSLPDALLAQLAQAARQGELINAVASEPALGSPSRGGVPATTLTRAPGGYRLDGHKTWATGARALDAALVTAAHPDGGVARALVRMDAPGVVIVPTWGGALSLRGSGSHDLRLEAVALGEDQVVRTAEQTPRGSAWHAAWFWVALGATYLGVGQAALDALIGYARTRVPSALGQPLATLPAVQQGAGALATRLQQAALLLDDAARSFEAQVDDEAARPLALARLAAAKVAATNAAVAVTDGAARLVGGAALSPALPFERLLRDARAGLTHPPTDAEGHTRLGAALLAGETATD
jgi:alkylation response protein AidB-like acyl-CoA dehydrogenase